MPCVALVPLPICWFHWMHYAGIVTCAPLTSYHVQCTLCLQQMLPWLLTSISIMQQHQQQLWAVAAVVWSPNAPKHCIPSNDWMVTSAFPRWQMKNDQGVCEQKAVQLVISKTTSLPVQAAQDKTQAQHSIDDQNTNNCYEEQCQVTALTIHTSVACSVMHPVSHHCAEKLLLFKASKHNHCLSLPKGTIWSNSIEANGPSQALAASLQLSN